MSGTGPVVDPPAFMRVPVLGRDAGEGGGGGGVVVGRGEELDGELSGGLGLGDGDGLEEGALGGGLDGGLEGGESPSPDGRVSHAIPSLSLSKLFVSLGLKSSSSWASCCVSKSEQSRS